MKLRFLFFFLVAFVLIFVVLNSRFAFVNIAFWMQGKTVVPAFILPSPTPFKVKPVEKIILTDEATLFIDDIGISAPIIFGSGSDTKNIYSNLEKGVVLYPSTLKPGMSGVSVILGHSSAYPWYKGAYGSVFALLGRLEIGDKIFVKYSDGQTFVFSVKQSIVFSPFKENPQLTQIEQSEKPTLVLISCWPIGTNYKRIAVVAELL